MKRSLQKMISLVCVLMLAASFGSAALAKSVSAKVSESSAKFYEHASASSDHVRLDRGTKVTVKDVDGKWAKVKYKGVTGYMKVSTLEVPSGSSHDSSSSKSSGSWKSKVVALEWFEDGKHVLSKGHYGYIYDINSGKTIKIKRMGGVNHADIEPATRADARKLKSLGASWHARPVILKVGGKYVAASINTMPHGDQTIHDNDFEGQVCLHMVGSTTHGTDSVRSDHQAAIKKAYNWAH